MANTGKYVGTPQSMIEHAALLSALDSIPDKIASIFFFEAGEVAALLRVDTKTLQRKRKERELALSSGEGAEINELVIASIAFAPPNPVARYPASEVAGYLRRLSAASSVTARPFGLTRSTASNFMGFRVWMSMATPVDDWPCTIDGRGQPMDFAAAITLGQTTGEAERLTLRQFAERLAHCSGQFFQDDERAQIAKHLD